MTGEAPEAQPRRADLPSPPSPSGGFFSGLSTAAPGDMPVIVLAQVGLTVLDGIIVFIYLVMSMIDISWLAVGLRTFAIVAMVLSIAPMVLGAIIMRQAATGESMPPERRAATLPLVPTGRPPGPWVSWKYTRACWGSSSTKTFSSGCFRLTLAPVSC